MARYIDADELLNALKEERKNGNFVFTSKWIKEIMDNLPTADVVPKSEVERLRFNLESVLEEIPETKREVASEIFEFIENNSFEYGVNFLIGKDVITELKKKYIGE